MRENTQNRVPPRLTKPSVASQPVLEKTVSRSSASEPQQDDRLDFSVTELRSILGNTAQEQRVIEFGKAKSWTTAE